MSWTKLQEVEFDDTVQHLSCDTRDFSCTVRRLDEPTPEWDEVPDLRVFLKYKDSFFFTIDEVKAVLTRLWSQSGGDLESDWRFLQLENRRHATGNWQLKYVRVRATEHGYLIGAGSGDDIRQYNREFWNSPVKPRDY